jgi:hypothetical protein
VIYDEFPNPRLRMSDPYWDSNSDTRSEDSEDLIELELQTEIESVLDNLYRITITRSSH